jgi:predicted DNA-binding protein with PD1-like motif
MHSVVSAQLGRIVYAHLEPEEDVLLAIEEVIEREQLGTGIILAITGAVSRARLSLPVQKEAVSSSPGFIEFEGLSEVQGGGYFGRNVDSWSNDTSQITFVAGRPHIHCHMAVATAGTTYVGHLIEGCKVRSVYPQSHFVVVLAEAVGVDLTLHCSEETTEAYPKGIPYYTLAALADVALAGV